MLKYAHTFYCLLLFHKSHPTWAPSQSHLCTCTCTAMPLLSSHLTNCVMLIDSHFRFHFVLLMYARY